MKLRERDEKNIAAGREIGFSEGLVEGIDRGREEGRAETAAKMKEAGLSIEIIAECTGLTPDEIKKL